MKLRLAQSAIVTGLRRCVHRPVVAHVNGSVRTVLDPSLQGHRDGGHFVVTSRSRICPLRSHHGSGSCRDLLDDGRSAEQRLNWL